MELSAQAKLEAFLVSHAHIDHVRDLATLADNRCQMQYPPLIVAGTKQTLAALRHHIFNGVVWPDFSKIPSECGFTIEYLELEPDVSAPVAGKLVRPTLVDHSVESASFPSGPRADPSHTAAIPGQHGDCGKC